MPPVGTTPLQYLTRLLAALVRQSGGELRIKSRFLREVTSESARQALFEDTDAKKDEIVLRFGSKDSAIYPVEPECRANGQPAQTQQPVTAATMTGEPSSPGRVMLSDADLAKMELKIRKMRTAHALRKQQQPNPNASPIPNM